MSNLSSYIPLIQQPYCCVPACIQMILLRRKLPLFSQEEIGKDLGLTVPRAYKKILPGTRTARKAPDGLWGTQVQKKKYSLNNFFEKHHLPLLEQYFPTTTIDQPALWVTQKLKSPKTDIIVCFSYKGLYKTGSGGHVSLITAFAGDKVTLLDPLPEVPKNRVVKLNDLLHAMKRHGLSSRQGFWIIENK